MTVSGESHRWAVVPPLAAAMVVRDYARTLREWEARGQSLVIAGQEEYGRQVLAMVSQIRASGRARLAAIAEVGTSEVPIRTEASESDRLLGSGLTTRQVAERFGYTGPRQVLNLIESGRLSATWVHGRYVVDEVSVAEELERRRAG